MCGRYYLKSPGRAVQEALGLDEAPELAPRYNIAPSTPVVAVRQRRGVGGRELCWLRWGLIPFWAEDRAIGLRTINARAETAASRPAFREAMAHRRCLLPADGFFEWKKGAGGVRQPFAIGLQSGGPFAMAGVWERWRAPDGEVVESCAILTTAANALVVPLHDRMPLILHPADHAAWLDPNQADPAVLRPLLVPFPADAMAAFQVSTRVNAVANDDPECIAPLPAEPQLDLDL